MVFDLLHINTRHISMKISLDANQILAPHNKTQHNKVIFLLLPDDGSGDSFRKCRLSNQNETSKKSNVYAILQKNLLSGLQYEYPMFRNYKVVQI
jgi:hypothetical protein